MDSKAHYILREDGNSIRNLSRGEMLCLSEFYHYALLFETFQLSY